MIRRLFAYLGGTPTTHRLTFNCSDSAYWTYPVGGVSCACNRKETK